MAGLFTGGIALPHIAASGNADLVDRFVRPTLAGETIGSLAITEPGGGSDVGRHPHDAPCRDGDHYVVNGAKTFITSGVRADFVTTAVRTGGPGHGGRLAARRRGRARPGFTVDRSLRKMGWHCSDTAELSYVDVRVPVANLVGEEDIGLLPDRRAVRGRADRAGRARLRHRGPLARADRGVLPRPRDVRQAADRQPGGAAQARRDAPPGRGGAHLHARGRRAPRRRRERRSPRPAWPSRPRATRRRTSATRRCSCTAAPATCTGPRWSGTTATPGSCRSEEERPRCSPIWLPKLLGYAS